MQRGRTALVLSGGGARGQQSYLEAALDFGAKAALKKPFSGAELLAWDCTALGLPEEGFVFACFNQAWKFTPEVFDLWCSLLLDVPGSVLWLLDGSELTNTRLRAAAMQELAAAGGKAADSVGDALAGAEVAILDDGYQHWQLERDLDILLVDLPQLDEKGRRTTKWYIGTRNFSSVLRYNRSYFYAAAVAMLANRIAGIDEP